MKISKGDYHWLGDGAYFYKECAYAYRWIHLMCEKINGKDLQEKDVIENYMILQADINLQKERLFDLDNPEHNFDFNITRKALEKELSKSEKYTHKRITDGAVINIMFKEMGYQEQYDAYKGKGKRYDDKTGKERTYRKFLSKSNTKGTRQNVRKKWN